MEQLMKKDSGYAGLRNIDELLTLTAHTKLGSIDEYFRKEIRDIVSCLLDTESNLTEDQVVKFAEEEIEQLILDRIPNFRQSNIRLQFIPEIRTEYAKLKKQKRRRS